jgi:AraC-like DNA-binding protein
LAKIAARAPQRYEGTWSELDRALTMRREHGVAGCTSPRIIAAGNGWTVADVVCTCGPGDRPFEEQHDRYAIAAVVAGTFHYSSPLGVALMTPGSLMLGSRGQSFECGHAHGEGDRCVSFWYETEYFERLAADVGVRQMGAALTVPRLPALRDVAPLVTRAALGVAGTDDTPWEELGVALAASTLRLAARIPPTPNNVPSSAAARVAKAVRTIDRSPGGPWTLGSLARDAGLSPYHFLRTFDRLTGVTPHQYVLRARLREAALRLVREPVSVLDIALDSGFGDLSNFNRAFRTEFGVSPRRYRVVPPRDLDDKMR